MKFILMILITINIYANIEVKQNIKALYKNVKLTNKEKNYIEENIIINTETLKKALIKKIKINYLKDKNIISFILLPDGTVKNIKFLVKSENYKINKLTKETILETSHLFKKPKKKIEMRFIIYYNIENIKTQKNVKKEKKERYYQTIENGTTRFEYSSREYIRVFETNEDGFINLSLTPSMCAKVKLLTIKNQKIFTGYNPWYFNAEIPKGKYKILIKVKKTCDVSIQYL